jgi:uracil-DNA glycosylase
MNAQQFIQQLSSITFPYVFNPYRDVCADHDYPKSPAIRRENLNRYLDAALTKGIDSLWLGRDCGYRGGRRTGIALTDEIHLETLEKHFGIKGMVKATLSNAVKERTATEVWKIIQEVNANVFLWNVFPFHPYETGNAMSNRRHTAREFNECQDMLVTLIRSLRPKRLLTLGIDAQKTVLKLGFQVSAVRHPSYGGHIEFAGTVRKIYRAQRCA